MIEQLWTPRAVSMRLRMPWDEARTAVEQNGGRIIKIGSRERVLESDLSALIEKSRQPTAVELAARDDLTMAQMLQEMGLPPKRRRRVRAGMPS